MFLNSNNKYLIKIPSFISVFYFKKSNIIVFKSKKTTRFTVICFKLKVLIFKNQIFVFNNFLLKKLSNNLKKKLNSVKKKLLSFLKHFLIEIQVKIYGKLKFIGIGYKLFKTNYNKILLFKLGYSHSIYLKLNLKFFNLKFTKLFLVSQFYKDLTRISALIRKFKQPDSYKGKGILYEAEKIKLKTSIKKN